MYSDHGRSKLRKVLGLLIILSLFSLTVSAQDTDTRSKFFWWRNENVRKELDLSDEQVKKIEGIFQSYKQQIQYLQDELIAKEGSLRQTLQSSDVSRDEVLYLTDEVEQIKAKGRMMKVDMLLEIRAVLTNKQRTQLHKIKHEYFQGLPKNTDTIPPNIRLIYSS